MAAAPTYVAAAPAGKGYATAVAAAPAQVAYTVAAAVWKPMSCKARVVGCQQRAHAITNARTLSVAAICLPAAGAQPTYSTGYIAAAAQPTVIATAAPTGMSKGKFGKK